MPQPRVLQSSLQSGMERKSPNLEFTTELENEDIGKSNESSRHSSRCLLLSNNPVKRCSGGDIISDIQMGQLNDDEPSSYYDTNFPEADDDVTSKGEETQSEYSANLNIVITPKLQKMNSTLHMELSKYKQELRDYTNSTKHLEEKYLKISRELNEMQQKHENFVSKLKFQCVDSEASSDSSSTGSEFSLKRKYTQVFHRGNSYKHVVPPKNSNNLPTLEQQNDARVNESKSEKLARSTKRIKQASSDSKENVAPLNYSRSHDSSLRDIFKVLQSVVDGNIKRRSVETNQPQVCDLLSTIDDLRSEQKRFRTTIEQQKNSLENYFSRCVKAQHVMQTQQLKIQKLNNNNLQLEKELSNSVDNLRLKVEMKLKEVAKLPQLLKEEQDKNEKILKDNVCLNEHIRKMQTESAALKIKMDEIARRKSSTINRLKASERDLKIFKNYNNELKHEKRKLTEELKKLRDELTNAHDGNKRCMSRQREQTEKQRRELQKRVLELEMKLNRSQNSTSCLLQERDRLITELQSQLNTMVHNFEVSQKHIRVLRRHIYSMTDSGSAKDMVARNRILDETA